MEIQNFVFTIEKALVKIIFCAEFFYLSTDFQNFCGTFYTVVILQRQFAFSHFFRCYSKITFKVKGEKYMDF